jgi:hypothetical protein
VGSRRCGAVGEMEHEDAENNQTGGGGALLCATEPARIACGRDNDVWDPEARGTKHARVFPVRLVYRHVAPVPRMIPCAVNESVVERNPTPILLCLPASRALP